MAATESERKRFGRRLRELRSARDLTAEQVGTALSEQVSGQNVAAWERGLYAPQRRTTIQELEELVGAAPAELAALLGYALESDSMENRVARLEAAVARIEDLMQQLEDRIPGER